LIIKVLTPNIAGVLIGFLAIRTAPIIGGTLGVAVAVAIITFIMVIVIPITCFPLARPLLPVVRYFLALMPKFYRH